MKKISKTKVKKRLEMQTLLNSKLSKYLIILMIGFKN